MSICNVKKVALYGAFDRYNYGDNLMPILLDLFFSDNYPGQFNFVFTSIKKSDLTQYKCMPTVSMRSLISDNSISSVIIVGGEVLAADAGVLYTHVQNSINVVSLLKFMRRLNYNLFTHIAKRLYGAVWDYPYIPNKDSFSHPVNVIYNTVGGEPKGKSFDDLRSAEFISVRDSRTFDALSGIQNVKLVPDSVLMLSKVVTISDMLKNVQHDIEGFVLEKEFIVIQCCPYKVTFTASELSSCIDNIVNEYDLDVVLLSIGYASGHDDVIFLKDVHEKCKKKTHLFYDLNVWEIMYLIANSSSFYGTSLHGVITAMSYRVPHFCINSKIEKLTSFLKTWSVSPYNQAIDYSDIKRSLELITDESKVLIDEKVNLAQSIIEDSFKDIYNIIK
ncbi:polysaccharide pyruvyl transferase family protein [Klebsiella pneumoniae]